MMRYALDSPTPPQKITKQLFHNDFTNIYAAPQSLPVSSGRQLLVPVSWHPPAAGITLDHVVWHPREGCGCAAKNGRENVTKARSRKRQITELSPIRAECSSVYSVASWAPTFESCGDGAFRHFLKAWHPVDSFCSSIRPDIASKKFCATKSYRVIFTPSTLYTHSKSRLNISIQDMKQACTDALQYLPSVQPRQ